MTMAAALLLVRAALAARTKAVTAAGSTGSVSGRASKAIGCGMLTEPR